MIFVFVAGTSGVKDVSLERFVCFFIRNGIIFNLILFELSMHIDTCICVFVWACYKLDMNHVLMSSNET